MHAFLIDRPCHLLPQLGLTLLRHPGRGGRRQAQLAVVEQNPGSDVLPAVVVSTRVCV